MCSFYELKQWGQRILKNMSVSMANPEFKNLFPELNTPGEELLFIIILR